MSNIRLPLLLNALLFVLVAILFFLFTQKNQPTPTNAAAAVLPIGGNNPSTGLPQPAIVYINIDTLMEKYRFYQDAKKRLENKIKTLEKDITDKGQKIETEIEGYRQKAQNNQMTEADYKIADQSVTQKQQTLLAYKDQQERAFVKEQDNLDKVLKDKINAYLEKIAQTNNYQYILSYNQAGIGMLYGAKTQDITQKVVSELNQLYQSEQK